MKWLRRIAIGGLAVLGVIVFVLATAVLWLRSESGRGWLAAELSAAISSPDQRITLTGLSGALPFHWRLDRVELADRDGAWLDIDQAALDLDPWALLRGTARVDTLTASRIAVLRSPAAGAPAPEPSGPIQPPALPRLPVGVELGRLSVGRIDLGADLLGEAVSLALDGTADLHAGLAAASLTVDRVDGAAGHVALHLDYAGPARLGLELHVAEPSGALLAKFLPEGGRRPFTLDLGGQGTLATWRGKLDVQAGDDVQAHADLALGRSGSDTSLALNGQASPANLLPAQFRTPLGSAVGFDIAARVADAGPIGLDHLHLTLGAGTLDGAGRYEPKSGALTARLATDLDPAPFQDLVQTALGGHVHVVATAGGTLAAPVADIAIDGTGLTVATAGIATLAAKLDLAPAPDGRLHVTSSGQVDGVTGNGAKPPAGLDDKGSWTVALDTTRDGGRIDVGQATLSGGGLDVEASGKLEGMALAGHVRLAAADLRHFAGIAGIPLEGVALLDADATSPDGKAVEAKLSGKLTAFRSGVPAADALLGGAVTIAAAARRVGDGPLDLSDLKVIGTGVSVAAAGSLDPAGKTMKGRASAEIANLGPLGGALGTPLGGRLGVTVDASGTLDDPGGTVTLTGTDLAIQTTRLDRLDATVVLPSLARKAAKVTAKLDTGKVQATLSTAVALIDGKIVKLDGLRLDGPATNASGDLKLDLRTNRIAGTLDARATDLAAWAPVVGQSLAGQAALSAKLTDQAGQGADLTLDAGKLALGDGTALQQLHLAARLTDLLGKPRGTVSLAATKLTASGAAVDMVRLDAEAKVPGSFTFTAKTAGKAQDKPFNVATSGRLDLAGADQALVLTTLDGKAAELPFRLDQSLTAAHKGANLALTGLALDLGGGKLSGRATSDGKTVDLALKAEKLPLHALAKLGGQHDIGGTAGLDLAVAGPISGPRGHVVVSVPDLKIEADSHPELPALQVVVSAELAPETLEFKGRVDGGKQSLALGFSGSVPIAFAGGSPGLRQDGPLAGKLEGEGRLEELGELIPLGEDKAGGRIAVNLSVGGTLSSPQAGGRLALTDGTYDNDASGMTLRGLAVELDGDRQAFVLHRFAATDGGDGKLAAEGKVDLASGTTPALDMTATLTRFTAARSDEATATIDGKIQVGGTLSAPKVTAELTMPHAEINIPDQLPSSVPELDVVRIDSRKPASPKPAGPPPPPPIVATLDVHFHDPGQTFVRGRGLTSEWNGDLKIAGTSAGPSITGEFDVVSGTFDALGKTFTVEQGALRFDGGLLPYVDLTAQVQAADVTAEITVQGPPTKPEIKLTSTPNLPQDEILSRVMFGTGVGQITPAQGLQLAQAAATLAGGGPSVLDRLRNFTGLDRLSVGDAPNTPGGTATGTTVSGGKYVAPGVFVGADQGLSGTSTRAKVEVEITPNITVKATAGAATDASSLGVQYKLDY